MPTSRPVKTSSKLDDILGCYEDIADLAEEMVNWRDNMPDSMQGGEKYGQVDEAADSLDEGARGLEKFSDNLKPILETVPGVLDKDISYTMHMMYKGYQMPRWVRLANPLAAFKAMVEFISTEMSLWPLNEDKREELRDWLLEADDTISSLEMVEFPSMYG